MPRSLILRGKNNFDRIFSGSKPLYGKHIDMRYVLLDSPEEGFRMAFIAGKKTGKATNRNRIKRRMREAYRQNRQRLEETVSNAGLCFHGALIARRSDTPYKAVEKDIISLLDRAAADTALIGANP